TAGILLGSAVGAGFAASMSDAALDAWGWRIPFLLGLAVGIAGYLLRRHVMETVPAERRKRAPIMETLSRHWRIVLGFAGLSAFNAVSFYVGFVYLVSWLQPADGIGACACARDQFPEHGGAVAGCDGNRFLSDRVG